MQTFFRVLGLRGFRFLGSHHTDRFLKNVTVHVGGLIQRGIPTAGFGELVFLKCLDPGATFFRH